MSRLLLLVLLLPLQEEFDPARVNRWIVSLSEDPTQEAVVGELHAYLKKHDKLALVYSKFEESFDRRPKDAKLRYLLGRLHLLDGKRASALKWFAAAAQADPDYPYTYLAQAELYQEQADEKNLVVALEGVIQSSKEKPAVSGAIRKLAEYYGKNRQLDRAASLWAQLGGRFPDDAALLAESVKAMIATGHLHRALETLRAALALQKLGPSDRARFHLDLAMMERKVGRPADAIQSLNAALQSAAADPDLARKIDDAILAFYREEDRLAELASQREKDLAINTTSALYIWRVARVRIVQNSLGPARELLAAGLEKNPGNVLLLSTLADVAALEGKHAEVRDLVRDLARREPARRDHRRREGEACLEMGQVDEAEAAFRAFAALAPEIVEVAKIYERRNRLTDAAAWLRRAIDLKPDAGWSRALVGILVRLDRLADAEQEAVRCTPGDRERWALLRDLLVERGEAAKACPYAKKDVEANPKDFQARLLLGRLQARVAPAEAETTFRQALGIAEQGQRAEVYEELAMLAPSLGSSALISLEAELKQLIDANPNDGGYCYALYRLAPRGLVLISTLEQGRKNDPKHVRLRQELAPYYVRQKQYDVAIDVYKELIEIDPGRRDLYVHAVGEVYWALGHKDQAFSWWAKVQGSGKDKVGISFQLAKKYESEKRYVQAIELLQQIIRDEPDGVLYHWALAQLYRQVNAHEGIVREFKWILAYSREEGHVRTARQVLAERLAEHGRSLLDQGEFRRALEELTEALRYAPDEPATGGIVAQIARTSDHLRDYATAAEHYHRLLSRYPGVAVIATGGRTMNAALFASLQLRGNPECLKAYEDLVGPPSKKLLEESLRKGDRAGMEKLVEAYPLSTAAGIAAFWLAESCRKDGASARAAGLYEKLLAELSLAGVDDAVVRMRLVDVAAQLKDWGTVQTQLGELFARSKDRTLTIDGKPVVMKDFLRHWQKELGSNAVGLGVSWGLAGRDSRNSWCSPQELAPPLLQKWRYQAAGTSLMGFPSISAAGGLVYLAKDDVLVALDATTGSVRWTAPLKVARKKARGVMASTVNPGLEGCLAVSQGVVAGIDADQELRVFDASTGAGLWTRASDVPRADGAAPGRGRAMAAVMKSGIEHMEILTATRQCFIVREGDKLRAYALRTGRLEWQVDVNAPLQPLAVDTGGIAVGCFPYRLDRTVLESEGVLLHIYGDSIRALDTATGKDLWEVKLPQTRAVPTAGWATYFSLLGEGVSRATISGDQLILFTTAEPKLMALELRTGKLRWELPCEGPVNEAQLAVDEQNVYLLHNRALSVHSLKTGVRLWRRDPRHPIPPQQRGMPPVAVHQQRLALAGSKIYLTSNEEEGDPPRLEAIDRKTGNTVWEFPWESLGKLLGGARLLANDPWGRPIPAQITAPVIADGWLYVVRSDGVLYAFHGKGSELAALKEAIRKDPDSPLAHFQLGDLLGSEGQLSLEIEEYRTAIRLAQKRPETAALKEMVADARSRLYSRFMRQGEASPDLEAALKAFLEARPYADGEPALARVLVRMSAVLLALKRDIEAYDSLSAILTFCPTALSPLDGGTETARDYAKRQLGRLGPDARARWEKAHAEEMEKAFAPGKTVEELEKAIERYSFSVKADPARIRAAAIHFEQKRYVEAVRTLDQLRPEFCDEADAEMFFEAYDLLGRALAALGEDRRALGTYQKMLTQIDKDPKRLGALKDRAEGRHKEVRESWERNGTFSSPLQKIWESAAPAAGTPKPAGPTMEAFRPAVDRGVITVLDLQGALQSFDASTGRLQWSAKTEDFSYFLANSGGMTVLPMDPLLAAREGVVAVGGKTARVFDGATGALLWSSASPDGDGVVHQLLIESGRLFTGETKGRISARDLRTGKLLWSTRAGVSATGVLSDRSASSGGGIVYTRIGVEGTRLVAQPAGDPGTLHGYDVATGKLAWKTVAATYTGYLKGKVTLEVGHGTACLADMNGMVACHDLADGKLRWKTTLGVPVDALMTAPDRVVAATAEQVVCLNAKSGKKEWSATPEATAPFYPRDKDMRINAVSLAGRGKWLVVGTAGSVSILEFATGQVKDQLRAEGSAPAPRAGGKMFPFGKSYASVGLGPEGIFWGTATDAGCRWTLMR